MDLKKLEEDLKTNPLLQSVAELGFIKFKDNCLEAYIEVKNFLGEERFKQNMELAIQEIKDFSKESNFEKIDNFQSATIAFIILIHSEEEDPNTEINIYIRKVFHAAYAYAVENGLDKL